MSGYSALIISKSPSIYYRLGESSGTVATDSSGNGRDGTYTATGVTYSVAGPLTGDAGTAVTLNGSSGSLKSAATLDLSAATNVTVEFWMKIASFTTDFRLAMETSANASSNAGAFHFDPNWSAGTMQLVVRGSGGNNDGTVPRPSTGVWHHYVGVYRKAQTTGALDCYIDGVLQTTTKSGNALTAAFGNFTVNIGSRNQASLWLNGSIAEFAIYPTELNAASVLANYNAAFPPVNTVAPAVTGTATVGQTLSTTTGTWSNDISSGATYQWKDAGGNIAGATSSTYVIGAGEVGASIHVTVTETGTGGATAADSNTVGPIAAASSGAASSRVLHRRRI